jgi:protein-S-isoprenylcysteine O-methyltransferase Ste14
MLSLLLRNLFFTLLQPGVVAGLVPYLLLRNEWRDVWHSSFNLLQYTGLLLFATGLVIMLDCILRFALEGKGTLSPVDPTRELVASGLYRLSRNPMYVGVMTDTIGGDRVQ